MIQTLIHVRTLVKVKDWKTLEVVALPMTSEDRRRVHRLVTASDGQAFALELPTGTVLSVDSILYITDTKAYRVTAAPEDVLTVQPRSLSEAALVGHLIGNLHRDIDIVEEKVLALWNAPLEEKLKRADLNFARETRPFKGKPAGEHSH